MNYDYESDLTIIGSGPAGLTAAIYACRANLKVIMLDKNSPGGKVVTTASVENYPGYEFISGPELSLKFFEQAQKLGAKFLFNEVVDIQIKDNWHYCILNNGKVIKSKSVIISTGMKNRKIGVAGEDKFYQKGISYCAICDGALYKNQPVAVIGSGRSAVEESIFLSEIVSSVVLISNKEKFKADQKEIDHLYKIPNIKIIMQTDTLSFNGDEVLSSITVKNQVTNTIEDIKVNGAFIFIGLNPVAPTVNGKSILSTISNFIDVNPDMSTNVLGLFAAGDIVNKRFRQISTAINDGTIAALSVVEYINNNQWN